METDETPLASLVVNLRFPPVDFWLAFSCLGGDSDFGHIMVGGNGTEVEHVEPEEVADGTHGMRSHQKRVEE